MAEFWEILDALNPRAVIEICELPHDTARGGYVLRDPVAENYEEFLQVVIHYTAYHYKVTKGENQHEPSVDFSQGMAKKFLEKKGGWNNSAYMALSGAEGGLGTLLNRIAEGFKEEAKRDYFNYIIEHHINMLDYAQRVEFMREFRELLANFCPEARYVPEEQMASPGQFESIIWNYMETLKSYRNLWQY